MAPPPKPEGARRRRNPVPSWTTLPPRGAQDGPEGAPALPAWRDWSPATLEWWAGLWAEPEAAEWDPSGFTLAPAALVFDALVTGQGATAALSAELRHHYDRHGLSPRARLQLRWRAEGPAAAVAEPGRLADAHRKRLRRQMGRTEPPSA